MNVVPCHECLSWCRDYPQFYTKLYDVLDANVFLVRYRSRFFELLHICLVSSTKLPVYLSASFAKRLGRLSLAAPPSGALLAITVRPPALTDCPQPVGVLQVHWPNAIGLVMHPYTIPCAHHSPPHIPWLTHTTFHFSSTPRPALYALTALPAAGAQHAPQTSCPAASGTPLGTWDRL